MWCSSFRNPFTESVEEANVTESSDDEEESLALESVEAAEAVRVRVNFRREPWGDDDSRFPDDSLCCSLDDMLMGLGGVNEEEEGVSNVYV